MKPLFALTALCLALPGPALAQTTDDPSLQTLLEQCDDPNRTLEARLEICDLGLGLTEDATLQAQFFIARGAAYRHDDRFDAAEADFMTARDLDPTSAAPYRNLAFNEAAQENDGLAMNWALRGIEIEPGNPRAYEAFFYMAAISNDQSICERHMDGVLSLLPPIDLATWSALPENYNYLLGDIGVCFRERLDNAEALIAYHAAHNLGLDEDYNRRNLAFLAYLQEQDDLAQRIAIETLERDGPHMDPLFALVGSYAYTGRFGDSLAILEEHRDFLLALEDDEGIFNLLGWQAFLAGEFETGAAAMDIWSTWIAGVETPPNDTGNAWDTLAQLRTALGDVEGAMEAFERSIETFDPPSDQIAFLRHTLDLLGYTPGEDQAELMATLRSCVETGAACRLVPEASWVFPSDR